MYAWVLHHSGVHPGEEVVILSANDPIAFPCAFGITRAVAVRCSINPRHEAGENHELLALMDLRVSFSTRLSCCWSSKSAVLATSDIRSKNGAGSSTASSSLAIYLLEREKGKVPESVVFDVLFRTDI
jgi:acyl-CoA synthetase (AMP-forming)/AMP-acid ligase II